MNKRMHNALPLAALVLIAMLMVSMAAAPASSAGGPPDAKPRVIFVPGIAKVGGEDVLVEIAVLVPAGKDPNEAAREALERQGARPFESAGLGSAGFTLTGLVWDNLPVDQNYNPGSPKTENEPASLNGSGKNALTKTHATWDGVATSSFDINFDGTTDRCPSLVRECRGRQRFDGNNDVAWLKLAGNVLGVTWFGSGEADIALNTNFSWNDGCVDVSGSFDAETVLLHENGHIVGLGHSDDTNSVMQPFYHGSDCDLGTDDEEGTTFLYDDQITGSVSGTVTNGIGGIEGATVVLEGTGLSATTGGSGIYTISGVPDPVTYDVTSSADGFESATVRQTVQGAAVTEVNFALTATGGGNGGGDGAAPVVDAVDACTPDNGVPGDRLLVKVTGAHFQVWATADFGARVTVQNVTFVNSGLVAVQIKVHPRAASGSRDITVTNPDGQSGIGSECFTVN